MSELAETTEVCSLAVMNGDELSTIFGHSFFKVISIQRGSERTVISVQTCFYGKKSVLPLEVTTLFLKESQSRQI